MLSNEDIYELLQRERSSYTKTLLKFMLGREPTLEEIEEFHWNHVLRREVEKKWLATQPWHVRKTRLSREDRIKRILLKRYKVPATLLDDFISRIEGNYW